METYKEMMKRHREEINSAPIRYAFNKQQLKEALEDLGATEDEVCSVYGHGDIVRKSDAKMVLEGAYHRMTELQVALENYDFALEAFNYEMDNHEYAINWSADEDTLAAFGFSVESFKEKFAGTATMRAYHDARRAHFKRMKEWGAI